MSECCHVWVYSSAGVTCEKCYGTLRWNQFPWEDLTDEDFVPWDGRIPKGSVINRVWEAAGKPEVPD